MEKASVLIATEGTYPCYSGGVSIWCDYLIRELGEMDFHLFALTHTPSQPMRFSLPPNVVSCYLHPIWGTEEPGPLVNTFSPSYERKLNTTEDAIRSKFLPHFEAVAVSFLGRESNAETLGRSLLGLYHYCRHHDYAISAGSHGAWNVFLKAAMRSDLGLTLDDATNCMRWIVRNLSMVAAHYPDVDVVHASIAATAGLAGVICKMRSGSAYFLTEHGLHLRELYLSLSRCSYSAGCRAFLARFHHALTRLNYYYADLISTLGEFNRRWQIQFGADPRKLMVIPNGVSAERFYPITGARPPGQTVLTMARISPIKGIQTLIRAAAEVRDQLPSVRFRILGEAGDIPYHQQCLRLVEEHRLSATIEFGYTDDLGAAYQNADIFCLPSLSEGMPFAVIEAMLSGCPVVASDVGCVSELIGNHGVLVKPNQPSDLAAALIYVLTSPSSQMETQTRAARERALRLFTVASMGERFRTVYKQLNHATFKLNRAATH